ncbi:MAG: hydrolase 2, exosortase A system-associated [Woeseia sp.]
MTRSRLEPFFLESSAGRIFLLLRAPAKARRCVLFVPPFGEEMNKCRRQVTETAKALLAGGYAALVVDLFGTGDSDGEFAEATWSTWKSDIVAAIAWIGANGLSLQALVATRLGCALVAESLRDTGSNVQKTVFWQPVENGRQYMTQFLRFRVAASMMESDGGETVENLKERLDRGETLEIAGYPLTPELWRAVEAVDLAAFIDPCLGQLAIFEVGRARENELSIAGRRLAVKAQEQGIESTGRRIPGEPFWSTTEIVVNPELTQRTTEYLLADRSS